MEIEPGSLFFACFLDEFAGIALFFYSTEFDGVNVGMMC